MKILILANSEGGLYRFRKELILELLNRGNEVFISVPKGTNIEALQNLGCEFIETNIDRRGINPITDFKLLLFYKKIFKRINPDFVITFTIKPNIFGGIVSRLFHIPYAINITGLGTAFEKKGTLKMIVTFLYKFSCKKAKVVFFENNSNKQEFIDNSIITEGQACKLNGAGVNLNEYRFLTYPEENEYIRFLFIGRIMREKGIEELFLVAKRIKSEYPNVQFDIVGGFEENYKTQVELLDSDGIINFYGYQANIIPFVKQSNCVVLPSYHEGMSNVLLESAACGRPLITSNIHGCLEAVEDNVNGYLAKVKDHEHLYSKIKEFIELPYEKKVEMGKKSRALMEKEFDKIKVVEKTINMLTKK
jgi:glycosyltransferase involved in cell wall biosynthesis